MFYGLQLLSLDIGIDRKFFWDMSAAAAAAAGQEVNPGVVVAAVVEVEWAECACCGLREECTPTYAAGVRARYGGRWLCGLCGEAVGRSSPLPGRRRGRRVGGGGGGGGDREARRLLPRARLQVPAAAERLIAAGAAAAPRRRRGRQEGEGQGRGGAGVP